MRKQLTALFLTIATFAAPAIASDPSQTNCVGNPPRQSEDPLSPPCVPFFDGDNGGTTYRGVTEDTIKFVLYNDLGIEGDLTKPWTVSDEPAVTGDRAYLIRTVKAYVRYFQNRYQTYNRKVVLIGVDSAGGRGSSCSSRAGDAVQAIAEHQPFGAIVYGANMNCFVTQMAAERSSSVGLMFGLSRASLNEVAPYVFTFAPSIEVSASRRAGFLCRTLAGGRARFTEDPTLAGKERRFGLVYDLSARGEADLLIQKAASRCGMTFSAEPVLDSGALTAPLVMQRMRAQGVTTVMCLCSVLAPDATATRMQLAANAIAYRPEWYWDNDHILDPTVWRSMFTDASLHHFGSTWFWRQTADGTGSYPYNAYATEQPGTSPNARYHAGLYYTLLTAFNGVQSSGPNLTPESLQRGLFTFNYPRRDNPYLPSGGFGHYSSRAIGAYAWVDTGMGWWFDPAGATQSAPGCIRSALQGLRYWSSTWPLGDSHLFVEHANCTGPFAGAAG